MCFQDWRIGRLIRSNILSSPSGGPAILLPANQNRVGLTIFPNISQDNIQIAITDISGTSTNLAGIGPALGYDPWHFTIATHGDLPTRQWLITDVTGANPFMVIEYIAPEWLLQLGIEQLKQQSPSWPK